MGEGPVADGSVSGLLEDLGRAFGTRNGSARLTAALLNNPGCERRAVLDAASVDLGKLADRIGAPMPFGQSPFAIGQGNRFERRIKEEGYAALARAIDELLGIFDGLPSLRSVNLERVGSLGGKTLIEVRAERTADLLEQIALGDPSAPHVVDHGVTTIQVGGRTVYLEQDALAFRQGDRLRVCEIKGFPIIDGTADPEKVGAAARQTAVYVASIQDTLTARGFDADLVSTNAVLVCPKNFSLQPIAVEVEVAREVRTLRRQLRRRDDVDGLVERIRVDAAGQGKDLQGAIAAAETQDVSVRGVTASTVLDLLPKRYDPTCLSNCDLARHCQTQARAADDPGLLGGEVAGLLGGATTMSAALDLVGRADPPDDTAELAELLTSADRALRDLGITS
jgi:hypothetical protein